jgi:pimeloyl-ACP methyl ester carboxylesterase
MGETGALEPTLILIPGLLCDERIWRAQRAAFEKVADVRIAEHALCDSLPGLARNILDNAPPRFAVAGHSMGGRIAFEVFRAAPERVAGLALMDTGYRPLAAGEMGQREAEGRFTLLAKARAEGMRAMAREWVQGMVHPARLDDRALIEGILDMFESKSPDLYAAQIQALLARPDGEPLLRQIHCPTLVLCGQDDSWAPVQRHRDIAAGIPGSTLVEIPACGHMSTLECPQAVNDAMGAWMRAVAASEQASRGGVASGKRAAASAGR